MTKQFENKWAKIGENVTFTCEAQIDALPVFLFYKLDKNILNEYQSGHHTESDTDLLDKYAKSLQNKNALSFYETTDRRVVLERREHAIDSSKDPLADFETIHLRINQLVLDDTGYYLCIVANSLNSFRVTYAFLNVSHVESFNRTQISINHKNADFFNSFLSFIKENIAVITITLVLILALVSSCCYVRRFQARMRKRRLIDQQRTLKQINNEEKKLNGFLQKTINSMKQVNNKQKV